MALLVCLSQLSEVWMLTRDTLWCGGSDPDVPCWYIHRPGTSTASCIGPLFYPVFLRGHQSTFCINFRTNKTTPISSYPASGSCLGEAGSSGTWLCKNIHLPCKSFMQQGRQQTDFLFKQQSLRSWCLQMLGWMIYFAQVWPKCKRNYFPLPFRQKVVNRGSIGATTRPPVRATHSTQHTAEKLSRKSVF